MSTEFQIAFMPEPQRRPRVLAALRGMRVRDMPLPCKTFGDSYSGGTPTRSIGCITYQPDEHDFPWTLRPRSGATEGDALALANLALYVKAGGLTIPGAWFTMTLKDNGTTAPAIRAARYLSGYGDEEIAETVAIPDSLYTHFPESGAI